MMEDHVFEYDSKTLSTTDSDDKFDDFLVKLWQKAVDGNILRYKIDDAIVTRIVPGTYGFILQCNTKRATHRRPPMEFTSLQEPFDNSRFNFNRIGKEEILFRIKRHINDEIEVHNVIVNVSPIAEGHVLLLPYQQRCLPQVLTLESLKICLELILLSTRSDVVMVANSLLAYASVNHLHYHFMYLSHPELLAKRIYGGATIVTGCQELMGHPMCGFLLQFNRSTMEQCCQTLCNIIDVLIRDGIPHNLFVVKGLPNSTVNVLLIPRKAAYNKMIPSGGTLPPFYVAACEVGGFIPVIDRLQYPLLTEKDIIDILSEKSLTKEELEKLKVSISCNVMS